MSFSSLRHQKNFSQALTSSMIATTLCDRRCLSFLSTFSPLFVPFLQLSDSPHARRHDDHKTIKFPSRQLHSVFSRRRKRSREFSLQSYRELFDCFRLVPFVSRKHFLHNRLQKKEAREFAQQTRIRSAKERYEKCISVSNEEELRGKNWNCVMKTRV